jgi:hypothetical protein
MRNARSWNIENVQFIKSTKGKQWLTNSHGPLCRAKWFLNGNPRVPSSMPLKAQQHSKLLTTTLTSVIDKIKLNKTSHSDYLSVFINLSPTQMNLVEEEGEAEGKEEEVLSPGVKMDMAVGEAVQDDLLVQALLDTGCLVGDCMSQEIADKLNASHLVVNINATICSGFNNQCSSDFPSLLIKMIFVHQNTFLKESFITRVLILPESPIDIIIGRKIIKTIHFPTKTLSHSGCEINLTSRTRPVIDFGDTINNNDTQEIHGVCIPSNYDLTKTILSLKDKLKHVTSL